MEPTQPKPIATWSPTLDVWLVSDDETESLFSVPSAVFSEIFPTSGTWADGTAYELPTSERRTDDSGCSSLLPTARDDRRRTLWDVAGRRHSLLPSPRATDGTKGGPNQRGSSGDLMLPSAVQLLPTPTTQDGANNGGPSQFDRNTLPLNAQVLLLPTPAVNDMGASYTPETWDAWCAEQQAKHGNGNGHGKSLHIETMRLLPTPNANEGGQTSRSGDRINEPLIGGIVRDDPWGEYAECVTRWERIFRPPPQPTKPDGKNGARRLNPAFSEWMMGLPAGWVTDVPGITRNEALKALGNGVVPQQAEAAIRWLLARIEVAA